MMKKNERKKSASDFKFIKLLGEGSYSSVYLAIDATVTSLDLSQNESGIELESDSSETNQAVTTKPPVNRDKIRRYAVKVCSKRHIKRQSKQVAIMREKNILNILNQNPNDHFIRLYCTFQDIDRLYFVMTYAENGDLLSYMQEHPLDIYNARNYTNQLVNALEHIHKLGIVHRDLKPENILLNEQMNLLLSDFGSAQIYSDDDIVDCTNPQNRRNSFVGTAQYVSPEMLQNRLASNRSDLWALGIIVHQMLTNTMLFNAPNEYLIYQKIQNLDFHLPDDFDAEAGDFITSLVKLEPTERLGAKDNVKQDGYVSIREHRFLDPTHISGTQPPIPWRAPKDIYEDLFNIDQIKPGLDELQLLRILTIG